MPFVIIPPQPPGNPPLVAEMTTGRNIRLGNLLIDLASYQVYLNGSPVDLTPREFDLLLFFVRHPGRIVDGKVIAKLAWQDGEGSPLALRMYIHRLRTKLAGSAPWIIKTVPKRGYGLITSESVAKGHQS